MFDKRDSSRSCAHVPPQASLQPPEKRSPTCGAAIYGWKWPSSPPGGAHPTGPEGHPGGTRADLHSRDYTGRENVLLPLSLHSVSGKESQSRLTRLAEYLEITDVLEKFPAQMSGGQKQRVAAARALIMNPGMILADEPTGALDSKNAKTLMEKLAGLNREENATILMVTHDSNAASSCKRILFIQDGVIFHELRRNLPDESQRDFYGRILNVMAQLGGGSANVL